MKCNYLQFVYLSFYTIIISVFLVSCNSLYGTTYDYVYKGQRIKTDFIYRPCIAISEYKGGYWGEWETMRTLRYYIQGSSPKDITVYTHYVHPSQYMFKISLNKFRENKNGWEVYDGKITIAGNSQLYGDYSTFPATIKRTKQSNLPLDCYIDPELDNDMKYVYNVYFDDRGIAFMIDLIKVTDPIDDPHRL